MLPKRKPIPEISGSLSRVSLTVSDTNPGKLIFLSVLTGGNFSSAVTYCCLNSGWLKLQLLEFLAGINYSHAEI